MINVITLPVFIEKEVDAIVALLEQRGIDFLHLRKPEAGEDEVEALLREIPAKYFPRITMHDHYALAARYELGGIHLTGRHPEVPETWRGRVSTSCHSIEELGRRKADGYLQDGQSISFDYLTLSPIFDSISKQGYHAAFSSDELETAKEQGIIDQRVLALGGITFNRIPQVLKMGFGGAMILGDAWK